MGAEHDFDLVVVGAGAAGNSAAKVAAEAGARVALCEKDHLGGTCLNYGCDPTKALLETAHRRHHALTADALGVDVAGAEVDWARIRERVATLVQRFRGGTPDEAAATLRERGIDLHRAEARFVDPHTLAAGEARLRAEQVILATGTRAVPPPIEGLPAAGFITNREAVWLDALPRQLAIIGGGATGVEFAQMFGRLGVEVTLIEREGVLMHGQDAEQAARLQKLLADEGLRIECDSEVGRVLRDGDVRRIEITRHDGEPASCAADVILVATGRRPVVAALRLDTPGVRTDRDRIGVDATLRTNVAHIWAAGDCIGGHQFTHVASAQGKLAAQNALSGDPQPFDDRAIPGAVYTDPELGWIGPTAQQLRDDGVEHRVGCLELSELARAVTKGRTEGQVKVLAAPDDTILGAHVLAPEGGELLAPVALAMRHGIGACGLYDTLFPYPTMSESLRWAAKP